MSESVGNLTCVKDLAWIESFNFAIAVKAHDVFQESVRTPLAFGTSELESACIPLPNGAQSTIVDVAQFANVKCREGDVALERLHIQLASVRNITLSDFDKSTEPCAASPAIMEQIADERVQNNIHTFTICCSHDGRKEGRISGVEDILTFHSELVDQEILLFLCAYRGEDSGAFEMSDLYGRDTDTASSGMDEY